MDIKEALEVVNAFSDELLKAFKKDSTNNKEIYKDLSCIGVYNKTSAKLKQAIKLINTEYNKLANKPPLIKTIYKIPYTPMFGKTKYFETEYDFKVTDIPCSICGSKFLIQTLVPETSAEYYCPNCNRIIFIK